MNPADETIELVQSPAQRIIADVMHRRRQGEAISDQDVLAAHEDLRQQLAEEFARLQDIERFARRGQSPMETKVDLGLATLRGPVRLTIRCPHCREPFLADGDTPVTEFVCSSCGSSFNLTADGDALHGTPVLQSLGHFELIERIGVGGFGAVWKCLDTKLQRLVAVKIPRRHLVEPRDLEKFIREARAAAHLQHPHIVCVHEVGRENDIVFIVSDFIGGVTLDQWLTTSRPTAREAAHFARLMADALEYAHQQGVVHRDLKPANIIVDQHGEPHITDFGLARRETGDVTMTMDGQVIGTPAYMSPEQACGESRQADRRTDVYSLGVILYELLTGERPFRGNTRMLIEQVKRDPPPAPRRLVGSVPRDLETIVLKCLEKSPGQRYQTAAELSAELTRFLDGQPIVARPCSVLGRAWRWFRRNPNALTITAGAYAAILGAILWLWSVVGIVVTTRQPMPFSMRAFAELLTLCLIVNPLTCAVGLATLRGSGLALIAGFLLMAGWLTATLLVCFGQLPLQSMPNRTSGSYEFLQLASLLTLLSLIGAALYSAALIAMLRQPLRGE